MKTHFAYCSACDRQVEVLVREDLPEGHQPSAHDAANCVCMEYGESCTGAMCPLFEVPTEQMREALEEIRREREGVRPPTGEE